MLKWIARILIIIVLIILFLFWYLFFSPRPVTTDPVTLAGDGSAINYCALPDLNGDYINGGKRANEIPKANTPLTCRYDHFPLPILRECVEPLAEGADDIRGLWQAVDGKIGHVERIEQCGSRTVVTAAGIIHDYGPNSTLGLNTNDTEGSVAFTLGGKEYCNRTSASMVWNDDNMLEFYAFGWGPKVVTRYRDGDELIWEYVDGSITRMKRICTLPDDHKIPKKR